MDVQKSPVKKNENVDNVPVTVYRIIGVPSNIQGLNNTTIQIVPKLENDDDDDLDSQGDSERHDNVTYASFLIDEDAGSSDPSQSTPQVIWTTKRDKSGLFPFSCTLCPKRFKHHSHLKRHVNTHTGERLYRCDTCSKTFLDASTLSRHRRIHSGDKPWECKVCHKTFGTLGSLRRHMTIHNQEGRPFQCDVCFKRFPDNSSFQKHRFIHTGIKPHVCGQCGKAFVHIGDLNGHRKIHVDVKPYNCQHCHKDFAKYSNYARHLQIHEGEREYTCTLCGVSYNYQSSLTRHLLTHVHRGNKALLEATKKAAADKKTSTKTHLADKDELFILPDDPSMIAKHIKVTRTKMKHRMIEHLKKTCMKTASDIVKETLKTEAMSNEPTKDTNSQEQTPPPAQLSEKDNATPVVNVLEVPETTAVMILNGTTTEVLDGTVVLSVDSVQNQEEQDPTILPPEDETISRLSTTEDVQLLLYSAENFGSTKDFLEPLLPPPETSSSSEPLLALLSSCSDDIAEDDPVPSTSNNYGCEFAPLSDNVSSHDVHLSVEPETGKVLATLSNVSDPECMLPLNSEM